MSHKFSKLLRFYKELRENSLFVGRKKSLLGKQFLEKFKMELMRDCPKDMLLK